VFGQAGSGFPALVRLERSLGAGPTELVAVAIPTLVGVGCIVAWVCLTRGGPSVDDAFARVTASRSEPNPADAD
jgi:hypothetical protein